VLLYTHTQTPHTHTHTHTYIDTYIDTHIHTYTHTYIRVYIHTYDMIYILYIYIGELQSAGHKTDYGEQRQGICAHTHTHTIFMAQNWSRRAVTRDRFSKVRNGTILDIANHTGH
jgi:hypothetical protein